MAKRSVKSTTSQHRLARQFGLICLVLSSSAFCESRLWARRTCSVAECPGSQSLCAGSSSGCPSRCSGIAELLRGPHRTRVLFYPLFRVLERLRKIEAWRFDAVLDPLWNTNKLAKWLHPIEQYALPKRPQITRNPVNKCRYRHWLHESRDSEQRARNANQEVIRLHYFRGGCGICIPNRVGQQQSYGLPRNQWLHSDSSSTSVQKEIRLTCKRPLRPMLSAKKERGYVPLPYLNSAIIVSEVMACIAPTEKPLVKFRPRM